MQEETKEKLRKVQELIRSENLPASEACKRLGFKPWWYHSTSHRMKVEKAKSAPKLPRATRTYKKQAKPTVVNIRVPNHDPNPEEVRVVVIKGDSATVREIVSGMGGLFSA